MKHTLKITIILLLLFFITQVFGLVTINNNITTTVVKVGDETITIIEHKSTIIGDPPKSTSGFQSVTILSVAILIGTMILLFLIKFRFRIVFEYWYLFAVIMTMAITFGVYVRFFDKTINYIVVFLLAVILAYFKIYRRNTYVHNITEIFVYSGIAVLLVALFEGFLFAAFALLMIISAYDIYAVRISKHMVKIAQFQIESKAFAGLIVPYEAEKYSRKDKANIQKSKNSKKGVKMAILGGGDIVFPLIFSGSVMFNLILEQGLDKNFALLLTTIIPLTTTLALAWLLFKGKQDKFYPAMPYISIGCIIGYLVIISIF